jgi:hypothetical protein
VLPISVSQVARITGVSHWQLNFYTYRGVHADDSKTFIMSKILPWLLSAQRHSTLLTIQPELLVHLKNVHVLWLYIILCIFKTKRFILFRFDKMPLPSPY